MINKENLKKVLNFLEFTHRKEIYTYKNKILGYTIVVDFAGKGKITYPDGVIVNDETTSNLTKNENFVVLECVYRLLKLGYKPECIELEPKWEAPHDIGGGGKADVLVKDNAGESFLLIECKTWGKEFDNYWKKTEQDGDQLFFYAVQKRSTQYLCMYASNWDNDELVRKSNIISLKDNTATLESFDEPISFEKANDKSSLFAAWNITYGKYSFKNGIFEDTCIPYLIEEKGRDISNITEISHDDIQKKYHEFTTILRQHNVSGRENAFDKLVNLFLAKIVDEIRNSDKLQFYWGGPQYDDYYKLQDRLQVLYKEGMEQFLGEEVSYIDESTIEETFKLFLNDPDATKDTILKYFRQLKFYTNNDFSFIDVYNEKLFYKNAQVLFQMVKMLQDVKLVTEKPNQFLGDLFEGFLDDGIKQSEGQFFTPTPIVRFLVSTLPLEEMIKSKGNHTLKMLDYACGAGHFLNEYARRVKEYLPDDRITEYYGSILGIEKEYRLSKVAKVSAFMYGQKDINIVYDDALSENENIKEGYYDLLITNPPYSVKGFLETLSERERNKYSLYEFIGKNSISTNDVIEAFFVERAYQLLAPGGIAIIVLPISLLNNPDMVSVKARELILKYFDIYAIVEFGTKTFGKTGTNTATLFMKKREENPPESNHYKNRVDSWFQNDRTKDMLFEDDNLLKDYCEMRGIDYNQYIEFIGNDEKSVVWSTDVFVEYLELYKKTAEWANRIQKETFQKLSEEEQQKELHDRFYDYVVALEKVKVYFYVLAKSNHSPVVVVKSPTSATELKKFLGYGWSDTKGDEGIKYVGQKDSKHGIDKIKTPLFNPQDLNDENKINMMIRNNFLGKEIVKQPHTIICGMPDLLDFSAPIFDKTIDTSLLNRIQIESDYELKKFSKLISLEYGKNLPEENRIPGEYPVMGSNGQVGTHNSYLVEGPSVIVGRKGSAGQIVWEEKNCNPIDTTFYVNLLDDTYNIKFVYYMLMAIDVRQIPKQKRSTGVPGLSRKDVYQLMLPIIPSQIQEELIKKCDIIKNKYETTRMTVDEYYLKIREVFLKKNIFRIVENED